LVPYINNTLREKYSSGPVHAVSFVQLESVTACLSSRIPLKKIIEFCVEIKSVKFEDNILIETFEHLELFARRLLKECSVKLEDNLKKEILKDFL